MPAAAVDLGRVSMAGEGLRHIGAAEACSAATLSRKAAPALYSRTVPTEQGTWSPIIGTTAFSLGSKIHRGLS